MRVPIITEGALRITAEHPVSPPDTLREFFAPYLSAAVLEVFPDWQGILLTCEELAVRVWVVRNRLDGEHLHAATGQPAVLLDDVLAQEGRNFAELWKALQSRLILS